MADAGLQLEDIDADDPDVRCRVATNSVLNVALRECGRDSLERTIAHMVGLDGDVDAALADAPERLEASDCFNLRTVRAWVVNRVSELTHEDDVELADAIGQAWDEANDTCGWE